MALVEPAQGELPFMSFSRRNVKNLTIRVESAEEWDEFVHILSLEDCISPVREIEVHPCYVMRMGDLDSATRHIFVNLFRSSEVPENHIVASDGPRTELDVVFSLIISTKDAYRMKIDHDFKVIMVEAVTRFLDMVHPDVHLDCEVVTFLGLPRGFAGSDCPVFSCDLAVHDVSLLLY